MTAGFHLRRFAMFQYKIRWLKLALLFCRYDELGW